MTCKPCRVTYQGTRYQINKDGSVWIIHGAIGSLYTSNPEPEAFAHVVRTEAARQRRNRNRRERHQAMTDLGLKRVRGNLGGVYYE